jgi:DnaK suppressor protein
MEDVLHDHQTLDAFRARLERWKSRLVASVRDGAPGDASFDPDELADEMDHASGEHSRSLASLLGDRERSLLRGIESALERIARGRFAVCEQCGQKIPWERLEAQPVTTLCVDCKKEEEELELRQSFGASRRAAR